MKCSINGCHRLAKTRGWCNTHYQRWRHHGSTDLLPRPTPQERFWAKVNKTETCWLWTGGVGGGTGYGHFWTGNSMAGAHRVSYEWARGPIPDGLFLDHICRNRACVNPDHLEPVTNAENVRRGESPGATATRTDRCKWGHSLSDAYVRKDGRSRVCRTCSDERAKEWRRQESLRLGKWNKAESCINGHPWTQENTGYAGESRFCRICRRISNKRSDAKRRGKSAA